MKKAILAIAAASAFASAMPAQAVPLIAGSTLLTPTPFSTIAGTQGSLLASTTVTGTALTFSALFRSAVYRNTLGTLDFYYQVARTGAGSFKSQMIDALTSSDFTGFTVDGYASAGDPDGAGFFTAGNNPPASTTTFGRSVDDAVIQISFNSNGLSNTENSATYIFRTNARNFTTGTFGVIDGSTFSGLAFEPSGAVPEPATWGLMVLGFGMVGFAARRRVAAVTA
jgi:hypothetical protein